jgi:hypothetical protein
MPKRINNIVILSFLCFLVLSIIVFVIYYSLIPSPAEAESINIPGKTPTSSSPEGEPPKIKVGVYILNIGELNTCYGTYTIDFYLDFILNKPKDEIFFEFMNGRATSTDLTINDPTEKFYRVQASLYSPLNLNRFPFDHHNLSIILEDEEMTSKSLFYEVSHQDSGIDPYVTIPGWDIVGWNANVEEHMYTSYNTSFSRYTFNVQIQRPIISGLFKNIFPGACIIIVGLISLWLSSREKTRRLTLCTGALISAVLFQLTMTSSLPSLGYLTVGDRFMLIGYIALLVTIIFTLFDRTEFRKLHIVCAITIPVVWLIVEIVYLFF